MKSENNKAHEPRTHALCVEIESLAKPIVEYLRRNHDPYCTIVITDTFAKLVRDEVSVPFSPTD